MQLRKKYEQIVDRSASKEALKNVVKGRLLNFDDSFFFISNSETYQSSDKVKC